MSSKILILISDSFPYGHGETFLGEELNYLSKKFQQIYILPYYIPKNSIAREVPKNCLIETFLAEKTMLFPPPKALLLKGLRLSILWHEFRQVKFTWFLRNFRKLNFLAIKAIFEAAIIGSWIENKVQEPFLLYSFWFSDAATACSLLKKRNVVKKWISGVHGYDLYDERHQLNKQPFRALKLHHCNQLYTACIDARKYLLNKTSVSFESKITNRYLGVTIPNNFIMPDNTSFVIVSCSNIISLKRIHLILDVLSQIDFPVKWIHIGDGILKPDLIEKAKLLPKNVAVEFKGWLQKEEILQIYLTESPHLFVHFSESEGGTPVSIMDALSCGIPILACEAGGIPEIVTSETGKILAIEFSITEAIDFINKIQQKEIVFSAQKIQEYCREKFNAEVNYTNFAKLLSE